MKRPLMAVLLLIATPALAQTGDCFAETGTTTTWQIIEATNDLIRTTYVYYDGSSKTFVSSVAEETDPVVFADSRCEFVDNEAVSAEQTQLIQQVCQKPENPENILPVFPEVIATDPDAPTASEARQRNFHRFMLRDLWGEPNSQFVSDCLLNLWQWVNTQGPVTHRRNWWEVTVAEDGEANSRFGSLTGAESILVIDAQYYNTELEDF